MNKLKDKTSNVLAIIRSDIKRLSKSVVAIVCVFGLALIPCLYAWFNIISNWDPYTPDSTKNLTIAVASEDEGTTFVGLDLNVGNIIIEKLKGNNQINWQFVDSEQAVQDGLYSGDYYAGLVIPADFSDSLLGFTDGEFETPEIIYYDNQKMNAVASRVTDRAQSIVKNEVNSIFLASIVDELSNFTSVFSGIGSDASLSLDGLDEQLEDIKNRPAHLCFHHGLHGSGHAVGAERNDDDQQSPARRREYAQQQPQEHIQHAGSPRDQQGGCHLLGRRHKKQLRAATQHHRTP